MPVSPIQNGGYHGAPGFYLEETDVIDSPIKNEANARTENDLFKSVTTTTKGLSQFPVFGCHATMPGAPSKSFSLAPGQGFTARPKADSAENGTKLLDAKGLLELVRSRGKAGEGFFELLLTQSLTFAFYEPITLPAGTRLRVNDEKSSRIDGDHWEALLPTEPAIHIFFGFKIPGGSALRLVGMGNLGISQGSKPVVIAGIPCQPRDLVFDPSGRGPALKCLLDASAQSELKKFYEFKNRAEEKLPLSNLKYFSGPSSQVVTGVLPRELQNEYGTTRLKWEGRDYTFSRAHFFAYLKPRLFTDSTPNLQTESRSIRGLLASKAEIFFEGATLMLSEGSFLEISDLGRVLTFEGLAESAQTLRGIPVIPGDFVSYRENGPEKKLRIVLSRSRNIFQQSFPAMSAVFPREGGKSLAQATVDEALTPPLETSTQGRLEFYSSFGNFESAFDGPCHSRHRCLVEETSP